MDGIDTWVAWNGKCIFMWGGSYDGTTFGNYAGGKLYDPGSGTITTISTAGQPWADTARPIVAAGDEFFYWTSSSPYLYRYMTPAP